MEIFELIEENYMSGYCTECKEITHDMCEPDAQGYECPQCGNNTVMGFENAVLIGEIEL